MPPERRDPQGIQAAEIFGSVDNRKPFIRGAAQTCSLECDFLLIGHDRRCRSMSLADRTYISALLVDVGKVQVRDDPIWIVIGINVLHGHFDARFLPLACILLRHIALVNDLYNERSNVI